MIAHSTSESSEAYIALGANLGDREQTLLEALTLLNQHPYISVLRCSALYETEPVGYVDQPAFLNMAAAVATSLTPEQLLDELLSVENRLGRVRDIRWGPRTVDLDLLWMQGETRDTEMLQLPHPRMGERALYWCRCRTLYRKMKQPICIPLYKHRCLYWMERMEYSVGKHAIGQSNPGIPEVEGINPA